MFDYSVLADVEDVRALLLERKRIESEILYKYHQLMLDEKAAAVLHKDTKDLALYEAIDVGSANLVAAIKREGVVE